MSLRNKSFHIRNNLQWFLVGEIMTGLFKKQRLCVYLPAMAGRHAQIVASKK